MDTGSGPSTGGTCMGMLPDGGTFRLNHAAAPTLFVPIANKAGHPRAALDHTESDVAHDQCWSLHVRIAGQPPLGGLCLVIGSAW